jgi:hypothetical protein
VFFNGNAMVRTGYYNGVPLYADTTVEPYSVILVPVGRGVMQPYERRRRGDLAGTTGSRAPSFPVDVTRTTASTPQAAVAPTAPPAPVGAIGVVTPGVVADRDGPPRAPSTGPPVTSPVAARTLAVREPPVREAVGTSGILPAPRRATAAPLVSLRRPDNNDGVWIRYAGSKWVSTGAAVPFTTTEFRYVGEYATSPVFAHRTQQDVVYLPTSRAGYVAPYRLKP